MTTFSTERVRREYELIITPNTFASEVNSLVGVRVCLVMLLSNCKAKKKIRVTIKGKRYLPK